MKFEIIEEHKNNNPIPLTIRKGTRVEVGKRSEGRESWPNWVYCYSANNI